MDVGNVRALAAFCQLQDKWASPKLRALSEKWMCFANSFCPFLVRLRNMGMDGGSNGQPRGHSSNCLRCIVGVKLADCHRLEIIHEQCCTYSLKLMNGGPN
eukprot:364487-Chlamydomonas_euryale.AAC.18